MRNAARRTKSNRAEAAADAPRDVTARVVGVPTPLDIPLARATLLSTTPPCASLIPRLLLFLAAARVRLSRSWNFLDREIDISRRGGKLFSLEFCI